MNELSPLAALVAERCASLDVDTIHGCSPGRHRVCRSLATEISAVAGGVPELQERARAADGPAADSARLAAELFLAQRLVRMNVERISERCAAHRRSLRGALTLAAELDRAASRVLGPSRD